MNSDAIVEQLEALHADSYAWALACCGRRPEDAEEILQTVYMKIIEGKARFDGKSSLKTWLFSVIRRTAAWHCRWVRLREQLRFDPPVSDTAAEHRIERREAAEMIVRALARISTRQRQVLELVFYHDMTVEEAASTMRVSVGSARAHYHRGKRRLVELLKDQKGWLAFV